MIRLFASTFGRPTGWIRGAEAVEAGAAGREVSPAAGTWTDDGGDSISGENGIFGELTCLYWIWKNVPFAEGDIVGFCHYNKCLDRKNAADGYVAKAFRRHPGAYWIVREPERMVPHDYPEDIAKIREILSAEADGYLRAWDALYDETGASRGGAANCHAGQMFYTDPESFRDYCAFLFRVLFLLRDAAEGDGSAEGRPAYHRRYGAFIGERLLSVYLKRNGCAYETREARYNEGLLLRLARGARRMLGRTRRNRSRATWLGRRMMRSYRSSYRQETEQTEKTE